MKAALATAGVRGPAVGDWLSLTYTGDDPHSQGASPKKLFRAEYAVNPNKTAGGFFGEQAAAPVQAAPSWNQQVAQAGPPPAFAGQVVPPAAAPAAAASPFAPVAQTQEAWPPAQAQEAPGFSTTVHLNGQNGNGSHVAPSFAGAPGAAPVNTAGPADQPLAPQRPWGNVPA